jgi:hypothetical protein
MCVFSALDKCQTQTVTCHAGYTGGGTATCATSGTFNVQACIANTCTPTQVSDSNFTDAGSITGTTGQVRFPITFLLSLSFVLINVEIFFHFSCCLSSFRPCSPRTGTFYFFRFINIADTNCDVQCGLHRGRHGHVRNKRLF